MISLLIIYAVISFISLLFMIFLMLTAPSGYENESGFHYGGGEKDEKQNLELINTEL